MVPLEAVGLLVVEGLQVEVVRQVEVLAVSVPAIEQCLLEIVRFLGRAQERPSQRHLQSFAGRCSTPTRKSK